MNTYEELPSIQSLIATDAYLDNHSYDKRVRIGQVFSSEDMARAVIDISQSSMQTIQYQILELGAGTGVLSISFIENLVINNKNLNKITLHLIENDNNVNLVLHKNIKYLSEWLKDRKIDLDYAIFPIDLLTSDIEDISAALGNTKYDTIVTNPPYYKINRGSPLHISYKLLSNGQINAYSIFLLIASQLAKSGSEIISITPTSFFNGVTFKNFRQCILKSLRISAIRCYHNRFASFRGEKVSQRIAIILFKHQSHTINSVSVFHDFDGTLLERKHPYSDVVSNSKIIIPPHTDSGYEIFKNIMSHTLRMADYGLRVSTGNIVPHETPNLSAKAKSPSDHPLIWMKHIKDGHVEWPLDNYSKPQYVSHNKTKSLRNGKYILIRRCAFGETRRHLYCSTFEGVNGYSAFSLENHVNFIHFSDDQDENYSSDLIIKLQKYLASDEVAIYLKSVCGSTQINAEDLNNLPIPCL